MHRGESLYQIKITNLTRAQSFTPILAATHTASVSVFLAGTAASSELRTLAEEGNVSPLQALLNGMPAAVRDVVSSAGLLTPGVTTSLEVTGSDVYNRLSLAAMLIPTNDAFVGLDTTLPGPGEFKVLYAYAYDAGTEQNDELCASIPGPPYAECGGPGGGVQAGNGEGAITIHPGMHGVGDFDANERDWRNPVARVTVNEI